jgi:hypothetical protein
MDSTHSGSQPLLHRIEQEGRISHSSKIIRQRYIVFFTIATVLITSGTVIWILNIINIIPGPWSSTTVPFVTKRW